MEDKVTEEGRGEGRGEEGGEEGGKAGKGREGERK